MHFRFRVLSLVALAAALVCAAAQNAPPVKIEPKEKQSSVELIPGQELTIVLPTTDPRHVWQTVANDLRYLRPTAKLKPLPGGPTAGASVSFVANRRGRTRLSFVYVIPEAEGEVTAADSRDIVVKIN